MRTSSLHLPLQQSRKAALPAAFRFRFCLGLVAIVEIVCRLHGATFLGRRLSAVMIVVGAPMDLFFLFYHVDKLLARKGWRRLESVSKTTGSLFRIAGTLSFFLGRDLGTRIPVVWWIGKGHRAYGMSVIKGAQAAYLLVAGPSNLDEGIHEGLRVLRSCAVFCSALGKWLRLPEKALLYLKLGKVSLTLARVAWFGRLKKGLDAHKETKTNKWYQGAAPVDI
jgi:uncharacterized membrane protein YsdA (DUF1294 family)